MQSFRIVSSLFKSRLKAKRTGDDAMAYVYKILMNSLYGRFGINPTSKITEVCSRKRYESLIRREEFRDGNKLSEDYYLVLFITTAILARSTSGIHLRTQQCNWPLLLLLVLVFTCTNTYQDLTVFIQIQTQQF